MKLLIRADGNARIGTGHVMRCLSLAQGWKRSGGDAVFGAAEITSSLEDRLRTAAIPFSKINFPIGSAGDAEQTIQLARAQHADWVVADGYSFDAEYQQQIKQAGFRLLLLDDFGHAEHYFADLVLNQNLHANAALYSKREAGTRLLLGTGFALLRQEFAACQAWKRDIPATARKVLVTLGGGDPDNVTGMVIEALAQWSEIEAKVVVGGSNPYVEKLKSKICNQKSKIELIMDAKNMPELMAWADVAIAAGGTTSWELAFMGLPSLVIVLADNQIDVAHRLDSEGVSINLGAFSKLGPEKIASALKSLLEDAAQRSAMAHAGRQLVDGNGVGKVVTRLRAAAVTLRPASIEDARRFWEWANDPGVRASAFSPEPIPWEAHQKWFAAKLTSPDSRIFVGLNGGGTPFGQIRFDWNSEGAVEIDVHVDAGARQSGLGSALICAGADEALALPSVQTLHAHIKLDNVASIRAFEKAGFHREGVISMRGQQACHLTLTR